VFIYKFVKGLEFGWFFLCKVKHKFGIFKRVETIYKYR